MKNSLSAEVKHVLELDAKRTPGKWRLCPHQYHGRPYTWAIAGDERDVCRSYFEHTDLLADGEFVAAAPTMADIIRQQQALLVEAREALEKVRSYYQVTHCHEAARETLTRLRAATEE